MYIKRKQLAYFIGLCLTGSVFFNGFMGPVAFAAEPTGNITVTGDSNSLIFTDASGNTVTKSGWDAIVEMNALAAVSGNTVTVDHNGTSYLGLWDAKIQNFVEESTNTAFLQDVGEIGNVTVKQGTFNAQDASKVTTMDVQGGTVQIGGKSSDSYTGALNATVTTLTMDNATDSSVASTVLNAGGNITTANIKGGNFQTLGGSIGTLNIVDTDEAVSGGTAHQPWVILAGDDTQITNLNINHNNSWSAVILTENVNIDTATVEQGTLYIGNQYVTANSAFSGKISTLDLEGTSNLTLYNADLNTDKLIYNTTGTVTNTGDQYKVTTDGLTVGTNMTTSQLSNMANLKLLPYTVTQIAITDNSSMDETELMNTIMANMSVGQIALVTKGNIITTYEKTATGIKINSAEDSESDETKTKNLENAFNQKFSNVVVNPFDKDAGAITPEYLKNFDANANITTEAKAYVHEATKQAGLVASSPVLNGQQAATVVNGVITGNVGARTASLRAQAASTLDVQGAEDLSNSNVWFTAKHGRTDVKNDSYATSTVSIDHYQLGYDHQTSTNAYFGGYIGSTKGNIVSNGYKTSIAQSIDVGLYGTKLLDKGQYLNYITRYALTKNKLNDSNWDTTDYGVTVEYGKKIQKSKSIFLMPYIQFDYDYMNTDSVTYASGTTIDVKDTNNFNAKIGLNLEKIDSKGNSFYGGAAYGRGLAGSYISYMNNIALPTVANNASVVYLNLGMKRMLNETSYVDLNYEKTLCDYNGWSVQGKFNLMF